MENVRFWETVTCVIIEKHKRKQGKKMKILAFDTSSTALSVALLEDEKLVAETKGISLSRMSHRNLFLLFFSYHLL